MNDPIVLERKNELVTQRTMGELADLWMAYLDLAPASVETYKKSIRPFFRWIKEKGIAQPNRFDVLAYREDMMAEHEPTTVQLYITTLKVFFGWLDQEGLYPDITKRVKGAKISTGHKRDYLTADQARDLLASIDRSTLKGKRDYAMIYLMLTTGLRTISLERANIEDVTTRAGRSVLLYQGKGHQSKDDFVKLAGPVEKALRDYMQARSRKGMFSGKDPLFVSLSHRSQGQRMQTQTIRKEVKARLRAIGLDSKRLSAHSLRHTAATLNLLGGGSLEETKQLLGHQNLNTTLIYSHALERESNESENRIAEMLE